MVIRKKGPNKGMAFGGWLEECNLKAEGVKRRARPARATGSSGLVSLHLQGTNSKVLETISLLV